MKKIEKLKEINKAIEEVLCRLETRIFIEEIQLTTLNNKTNE